MFLGVVQGIFSWLPILLYCGYFSMSFHSYITSPSKRKSDELLSYFKTYDFKKESIIGTPVFVFFSFGCTSTSHFLLSARLCKI